MKSLLLTTFPFLAFSIAHGQGTVQFNTRLTLGSPPYYSQVFAPDPADATLQKTGNTAANLPAGTQTYFGSPLTGSGWTAGLWAIPGNTIPVGVYTPWGPIDASMQPASPTTTFRTGTSQGCVASTTATLANVAADAVSAVLQLRVWPTSYGSWDAAVAAWLDPNDVDHSVTLGASPFFAVNSLGGNVNTTPPQLTVVSFSLVAKVPEPSTAALAILGMVCLLRSRFRK